MSTALSTGVPTSALSAMAARIGADPEELMETLKQGVFKDAKPAEFQALVLTAQEYQLNPILKELYAFPAKGGGIVPIVSIDGWLKIINRQPNLDGLKVEFSADGEEAKCTINIKDREHPVVVTEYLSECRRNTEPWKQMPKRMLRHKAIIQAARVAFGIGGVFDEDEGMKAAGMRDVTPKQRAAVEPIGYFSAVEKVEKIAPEGRQKKERIVQLVELLDVSGPKKSGKKTWWTAQAQTEAGNTFDMNTFSSTMMERLDEFVGQKIKVTLTQTPKGGFSLEDFDGEEVSE